MCFTRCSGSYGFLLASDASLQVLRLYLANIGHDCDFCQKEAFLDLNDLPVEECVFGTLPKQLLLSLRHVAQKLTQTGAARIQRVEYKMFDRHRDMAVSIRQHILAYERRRRRKKSWILHGSAQFEE